MKGAPGADGREVDQPKDGAEQPCAQRGDPVLAAHQGEQTRGSALAGEDAPGPSPQDYRYLVEVLMEPSDCESDLELRTAHFLPVRDALVQVLSDAGASGADEELLAAKAKLIAQYIAVMEQCPPQGRTETRHTHEGYVVPPLCCVLRDVAMRDAPSAPTQQCALSQELEAELAGLVTHLLLIGPKAASTKRTSAKRSRSDAAPNGIELLLEKLREVEAQLGPDDDERAQAWCQLSLRTVRELEGLAMRNGGKLTVQGGPGAIETTVWRTLQNGFTGLAQDARAAALNWSGGSSSSSITNLRKKSYTQPAIWLCMELWATSVQHGPNAVLDRFLRWAAAVRHRHPQHSKPPAGGGGPGGASSARGAPPGSNYRGGGEDGASGSSSGGAGGAGAGGSGGDGGSSSGGGGSRDFVMVPPRGHGNCEDLSFPCSSSESSEDSDSSSCPSAESDDDDNDDDDGDEAKEGAAQPATMATATVAQAAVVPDADAPKAALCGVSVEFMLRWEHRVRAHVPSGILERMTAYDAVAGFASPDAAEGAQADTGDSGEAARGFGELSAGERRAGERSAGERRAGAPPEWSIRGATAATRTSLVEFLRSSDGAKLREELRSIPREALRVTLHGKETTPLEAQGGDAAATEWFGRADAFLSHAWASPIGKLFDALRDPSCTGSSTVEEHLAKRLWVDLFAIPQHPASMEAAANEDEDEETLRRRLLVSTQGVIHACADGLVLLAHPWKDPEVLKRTWCWFEVAVAARSEKKLRLALPPEDAAAMRDLSERCCEAAGDDSRQDEGVAMVADLLDGLSIANSKCKLARDHLALMAQVKREFAVDQVDLMVKQAVADLLLAPADQRADAYRSSAGSVRLADRVASVLGNATHAASMAHMTRMTRLQTIMGWHEEGAKRLAAPIQAIRQDLAALAPPPDSAQPALGEPALLKHAPAERRAQLEKALALALTMRGRLLGDACTPQAVHQAAADLEEAAMLRRRLGGDGLAETLYNLGRALARFHETHSSEETAHGRDRGGDLLRAEMVLKESVQLQLDMRPIVPAAVGAALVLQSKVIDQRDITDASTAAEALALLTRGLEMQILAYGALDPRCAMTRQSIGWHCMLRKRFALALVWLEPAYALQLRHVKARRCPPLRVLYCLNMLQVVCDELQAPPAPGAPQMGEVAGASARDAEQLAQQYAHEARKYLAWLAVDPERQQLSTGSGKKEAERLRSWIRRAAVPDRVLLSISDAEARDNVRSALQGTCFHVDETEPGADDDAVLQRLKGADEMYAAAFVDGAHWAGALAAWEKEHRRPSQRVRLYVVRKAPTGSKDHGRAGSEVTELQVPLSAEQVHGLLPTLGGGL